MPAMFGVVGIAVKHMGTSLQFYRGLGLPIPEAQDTEAHVEHPIGAARLAWDTVELLKDVYGGWNDEPVGHRIELAFECESRAEVDTTYARLMEQGHRGHREPWDAFWGQRYAIVQDPDGNLISLYA